MCGIAGILGQTRSSDSRRHWLEQMVNTFRYRGPDADGFHEDAYVGLGFRRLSIIDLEGGHQPLCNETGDIWLICNGEIYNHQALRQGLEQRGHRFRSRSDVEVILHLYEEQGRAFVAELNGQFAFALYDSRRQTLLLGRDHFGIAPLFHTRVGNRWLFASEIKALLACPDVPRAVDLTGLDQILTFPGPVSPRTLFQGIHSLPPGHLLEIHAGEERLIRYWDLDYPTRDEWWPSRSLADTLDELDARLREAVRLRLNADVPVGFYLSGGLDSSLIAALIHHLSPGHPRHSFSIGFSHAGIDERAYQRIMAEAIGSLHHETLFDHSDLERYLPVMVRHAETPLRESYNSCSLMLSALVRECGIKVILTGEGADELFGGYVGYRLDRQRTPASQDIDAWMEQEARLRLWGDADCFYEREYVAHADTRSALYSSEVLAGFSTFDCTGQAPVDHGQLAGRDVFHQRSYLDCKLRMADHLLADHGDRVSYAHSVEARYPFLDLELFKLVRTIPPGQMLHGLEEKHLLKQLGQRYLPGAIVRRPKFSFVAPGSPYLLRQNREWIEDLLAHDTIRRQGYFNPQTVERLKTRYRQADFSLNQTYEDDLLMVILTFGIFLDTFGLPNYSDSSCGLRDSAIEPSSNYDRNHP